MATSPFLDPHKSPWRRGDVCTLGFERNCLVLNHTPEYLEVRWMDGGGIERIPTDAIDSLLRVPHADGLGPDGRRTNLKISSSFRSARPSGMWSREENEGDQKRERRGKN